MLWPSCCNVAPTIDEARQAFLAHVWNDPAWTWHMSEQEIYDFVMQLSDKRRS